MHNFWYKGELEMGVKIFKCPNCGGELQLDENFKKGFCIYCGSPVSIESDAPNVEETIAKINEERVKKLETLKQAADYDGMFDECQSILSTDSSCGIACAYAGFAIAHGANRMTELSKECYVGQMFTPNPMNIALPDLNNSYMKLQDSVATYFSKAIACDDATAINVVFDLIDEIAKDFADPQEKRGVYLAHGMSDCQNPIALRISTIKDYIAMKLPDFMKKTLSGKDKAVNNSELLSQRIKQSADLFEQNISIQNNVKFVPVLSAVIMGMKYNYYNVPKTESPNLATKQSDVANQAASDTKTGRNGATNEVNFFDDNKGDDKNNKNVVKTNKNNKPSKKDKKGNYFTNLAAHFKQMPMIYICLIVLAVGYIVLSYGIGLRLAVIIVPIVWICMFISSMVTYKRSVCRNCKSSLEYGDYSYKVVSSESKERRGNSPNPQQNHSYIDYYNTYEFTRICPKCGTENVFRKKLKYAEDDLTTGTSKQLELNLDEHATPGKAFTKKDAKILNIVGIVFTIIGVAMLIAGIIFLARFATGGAGSVSKGTDPKNYYGTYEYSNNNSYSSITLDSNGRCYLRNGHADLQEYEYEYVSAKWACKNISNYSSSDYKDKDAIIVYYDATNHKNKIGVYAVTVNEILGYKIYYFNTMNGYTFYPTDTDGRGESRDPKNYYYKYTYNSSNSISFMSNGYCDYVQNGERDTYKYEYVEEKYLKRYISSPAYEGVDALVVYINDNRFIVFYVVDARNLITGSGNQYSR